MTMTLILNQTSRRIDQETLHCCKAALEVNKMIFKLIIISLLSNNPDVSETVQPLVKSRNFNESQISSPSPGQYEWDKSFETSIKTRKSAMVDFSKYIDRQKNDMFSPDKSYDLPYRHRLGISIDLEVNNPLIQNVKSGVAFEKRVDREKVSFLRNINKQLSVQEQEQLDMRKERQTNVLSSLSQLDAHQFQNINKFEVRQQEKQKREIQTVLPQLDNTLQQSKQVKRNIKRFLRHTYKMTEDVLKKQIKSQIK
eukprot:403342880